MRGRPTCATRSARRWRRYLFKAWRDVDFDFRGRVLLFGEMFALQQLVLAINRRTDPRQRIRRPIPAAGHARARRGRRRRDARRDVA